MLCRIDTEQARSWSGTLMQYTMDCQMETSTLQSAHASINAGLYALADSLTAIACGAEAAEGKILSSLGFETHAIRSSFDAEGGTSLKKGSAGNPSLEGSFSYHGALREDAIHNGILSASSALSLAAFQLKGDTGIWVFDADGKLKPGAIAHLSLLAAATQWKGDLSASNSLFGGQASGSLMGLGAYTKLELEAGESGITVDGIIGAAGLRGEAETSFNVGNITVSLSGSVSLLAAEAGLTGIVTKEEISFGASAALGVGAGWNISLKKNDSTLYENEGTAGQKEKKLE